MKKAIWRVCNGEAHSNPMIDHCGVCMPHWGEFPTCPYCGRKITGGGAQRARCKWCNRMVDMSEPRQYKIDEAYKARENRMKLVNALRREKEQEKLEKEREEIRKAERLAEALKVPESALDAGDRVALQSVIRDLEMALNKTRLAYGVNDKVAEFEALRASYEAVMRANRNITDIMFKFVNRSK